VPHPTDQEPIELAEQSWLFVGGNTVQHDGDRFIEGAAYVERYVPASCNAAPPVVMMHGGVQTGTNFTATPDGRRGWLQDFLRAGYTVYILEQPERGRSGHALHAHEPLPLQRYGARTVAERFTAPAQSSLWPQASAHTQWPGTGVLGDPIFDNFFASQVEMLADRTAIEALTRDAGAALLDHIGPAVLLTHSQSGPFGWLIADARPDLVRGIVAIEPNGPPFKDLTLRGGESWYSYAESMDRPYGITRAPLRFEPPLSDGEMLAMRKTKSDDPARADGYLQASVPRSLPSLAQVPIVIVTAEASYHAPYDHLTSAFLAQAAVDHDFIRLEERGIRGNGHMVMLESNSHEVADLLLEWLARQGLS
jgi:pimeloyl-ACP methyl ester carboxylesterase